MQQTEHLRKENPWPRVLQAADPGWPFPFASFSCLSFRAGRKGTWVLTVERHSALSHTVHETFRKLLNLLASPCVAYSDDASVPASWSCEESARRPLPDAVCALPQWLSWPLFSPGEPELRWVMRFGTLANQSWRWVIRFGRLKFYLLFFSSLSPSDLDILVHYSLYVTKWKVSVWRTASSVI